MIFPLLYIFQIFGLSTVLGHSSFQCIDCRSDHDNDQCWEKSASSRRCQIETSSGYSCGAYKFRSSNKDEDWSTPEPTDDLSRCIPKDLNITDAFIEICCVWSKELGCQLLVKPGNEYTCGMCRNSAEDMYDNLLPCPCSCDVPLPPCHPANKIFIALHLLYILFM